MCQASWKLQSVWFVETKRSHVEHSVSSLHSHRENDCQGLATNGMERIYITKLKRNKETQCSWLAGKKKDECIEWKCSDRFEKHISHYF